MKPSSARSLFVIYIAMIIMMFATVQQGYASDISSDEARQIATEAYIYTYPLVLMDITRSMTTNVKAGVRPGFGPMNAWSHMRAFPQPISGELSGQTSIRCIPLPGWIRHRSP